MESEIVSEEEIPKDVLEFIRKNIDSVEHLDILQLLFTEPRADWTAENISNRIRSNIKSVQGRLNKMLRDKSVILSQDSQTYALVQNATIEKTISDLCAAYKTYRYRVIHLIFNKPNAVTQLADAFRIKKDDNNG